MGLNNSPGSFPRGWYPLEKAKAPWYEYLSKAEFRDPNQNVVKLEHSLEVRRCWESRLTAYLDHRKRYVILGGPAAINASRYFLS
jgi:hypothetical protein